MNGRELDALDGTTLVNGLTNDVHDTAKRALADRDLDGCASVDDLLATDETLGTVHGNGADRVLTQVGGDLEDEATAVEVLDLERVENGGEVFSLKLYVNDGTDDGLYVASGASRLGRVGASYRAKTREKKEEKPRQDSTILLQEEQEDKPDCDAGA